MDRNIGKKLDGRYEITELIGIGGMADVYKAIDIIEDKIVAVKILKNEFSNDEEFIRRFRNESKAIAVLSHPNIVKIFDVGFTDKIQFIVMEYIDGITLKEFMEQQRVLKWKDAIHFITQILRALQHAHDRGIVHRDIKPQNIMLFPDGTIKVMDFGIARFSREEGKTLSDKAIGSVHYISPEQARGDITDEKSDIYSVGVVLYEMLTGQKPFDADNPVSVAVMHMQSKAHNPREINDTIPEGLEEIVIRAMQKDATKRYQSAAEMIKDIEQFKKNPSIVFEYKYLTPQTDGNTKYFQPINNRNERNDLRQNDYEEYDDDDDEPKRSLFIPILTAVTAAVFIIAACFIAYIVFKNMNTPNDSNINMPNLVGQNYFDISKQWSEKLNIQIESQEYSDYEKDIIFYQDKPEGREVKKGSTVTVKVSKGMRMINIPDVYGLEAKAAQARLEQEGLVVKVMQKVDDITKDYAIKTDPQKNESVAPGTTVTLFISLGPEQQDVIVDNVVGKTQEEATKILTAKKLQPKIQTTDSPEPAGTVIEQSIKEKEIVKQDTEIILTVSSGVTPTKSWMLQVNVPTGVRGAYEFNAYVDGVIVGTTNVDNIGYIVNNKVDIKVTSSGQKTIIVEIKNKDTGKSIQLAQYSFDFTAGKYSPITYDYNAFDTLSE